jgi:hypothetical protein
MTAKLEIQVREMRGAEVEMVLEWASNAGRHARADLGDMWRAVDSGGLLLGAVDGEPAGAVAALRYSRSFGFIGLHVVRRGYEDSGVGQALWRAGMKRLQGRCVGVDADPAQRHECARYGFSLSHRIMRYQGLSGSARAVAPVVALKKIGLGKVKKYDTDVFPAARMGLLRHWMGRGGNTALGIEVNGACHGYGIIGEGERGWHIGPVYATSPEVAETLLVGLKGSAPQGTTVYLDVPEVNPPAVAVAKRLGLRKDGEKCRMYAGGRPDAAFDDWYAVCDGLG